jgi:hypothetical protein
LDHGLSSLWVLLQLFSQLLDLRAIPDGVEVQTGMHSPTTTGGALWMLLLCEL